MAGLVTWNAHLVVNEEADPGADWGRVTFINNVKRVVFLTEALLLIEERFHDDLRWRSK
jgi:hypothetical protein